MVSMPSFLNAAQYIEGDRKKQQTTYSGGDPSKEVAGPLQHAEGDLLGLTGEQKILSVDLKIHL